MICKTKKVFISTSGCAMLHNESQLYTDYFTKNGWETVSNLSKADFILLNLCSLNTERKINHLNYINKIKQAKSNGAFLAVTGCISTIASEEVRALTVDASLEIKDIGDLDRILGSNVPLARIEAPNVIKTNLLLTQIKVFLQGYLREKLLGLWKDPGLIYDILYQFNLPEEHKLSRAFSVMIAQGCMSKCSFCAIRIARGVVKSLPSKTIMQMITEGLKKGQTKIHLLATNPCQYGHDIKGEIDYPDLLARIDQLPWDFKIVLPDVEPDYFVNNFGRFRVILTSKKFLEITFAVQSASRPVLKRMHRYYDVEKFKECIKELRAINATLKINAHIMIGFPGETYDDFTETFNLIKALDFNKVLLFPYGDLPHTESSGFLEHLDPKEIKKRMNTVYKYLVLSSFKRTLPRARWRVF